MVVVAIHSDGLVVGAVAVNHDAPLPGHLSQQARQIQPVAITQLRRPLKNKHESVSRFDVQRETEQRARIRATVHDHLMPKFFSRMPVMVEVLSATRITITVVHEH